MPNKHSSMSVSICGFNSNKEVDFPNVNISEWKYTFSHKQHLLVHSAKMPRCFFFSSSVVFSFIVSVVFFLVFCFVFVPNDANDVVWTFCCSLLFVCDALFPVQLFLGGKTSEKFIFIQIKISGITIQIRLKLTHTIFVFITETIDSCTKARTYSCRMHICEMHIILFLDVCSIAMCINICVFLFI